MRFDKTYKCGKWKFFFFICWYFDHPAIPCFIGSEWQNYNQKNIKNVGFLMIIAKSRAVLEVNRWHWCAFLGDDGWSCIPRHSNSFATERVLLMYSCKDCLSIRCSLHISSNIAESSFHFVIGYSTIKSMSIFNNVGSTFSIISRQRVVKKLEITVWYYLLNADIAKNFRSKRLILVQRM